jgi:hypothetical protein
MDALPSTHPVPRALAEIPAGFHQSARRCPANAGLRWVRAPQHAALFAACLSGVAVRSRKRAHLQWSFLKSPISNLKSFAPLREIDPCLSACRAEARRRRCPSVVKISVSGTTSPPRQKKPFNPIQPISTRLDQIEPQLRKKIYETPPTPFLPSAPASRIAVSGFNPQSAIANPQSSLDYVPLRSIAFYGAPLRTFKKKNHFSPVFTRLEGIRRDLLHVFQRPWPQILTRVSFH